MYLALYRKYRPRTFDDVISQEHITTTLKNQVANGTAAHAYLFTGSRGTGKTTCAKIMAMAVNCLSPKDGSPCLECERCREIMSGEATDIVEMDAASNNGVDDVRRLRDEVAYTPVSCKFRVYIIDEVHMLSPAAFNALLKTLEEPPPHVKFILATTELHKVPATISSRCQRFEFRRVDIAESTKRLLDVAEKESVSLDKDAAELISRLSDGGMRDALSILDRCISADEHITSQTVRECAGVADNKHLFAFSEMVAQNDVSGCIRLLGELHKNSKDLSLVIDELSEHYRDLMLYKTAPNDADLLAALPDDHAMIAELSAMYDLENILRCLTLLQQCADNIGKTKQRKTLAEMCLVKMCTGADVRAAYAPRASETRTPPQPTAPVLDPPKDDFVRKTYEEMSERERITAKRTEELIKKTENIINAAKPDTASQPVFEHPPTDPEPSKRAPDISEPPPWEEAPPADDRFYDNEYPINSEDILAFDGAPEETPQTVPEKAADVPDNPENQSAEAPVESEASEDTAEDPLPDPPSEITEEQWSKAVSQMNLMDSSMFEGSKARLSDGVLEVSTANTMLLENVKDEKLAEVEKTVSEKLGFRVRLKLFSAEAPAASEEDQNKLDKLLSKARQLGIEVQSKND
ncbi:MAG: DNA polymerase III subunit gamma/tau [Oscillospiraceae bacterium]|nr:DNA polymerase III subunit gamma/tau [Oscillospiraceae bacterium]